MKCAIHQPQYLPWPGYFRKWAAADVFVFLDTVAFSKGDYVNRVKLPDGKWLTVPAKKAPLGTAIEAILIDDTQSWRGRQWGRIHAQYGMVPDWLTQLLNSEWKHLWLLAYNSAMRLATRLNVGVNTRVASAMLDLPTDPTGRLVAICQRVGADTYLSGPHGADYLDLAQFDAAGIRVELRTWGDPATEDYSALDLVMKGKGL